MAFIEIASGYRITYDKYGITGQRQFLEYDEASGLYAGSEAVSIPVIGDLFHDPDNAFQKMFCIRIEQEYLNNDKRKLLVTCHYSNEPIDNSNMGLEYTTPTSIEELPQDIEYSGEYQMWKASALNPDSNKWIWEESDPEVKVANAIPFRIRLFTRKFQRIVPYAQYSSILGEVSTNVGKVNGSEWLTYGAGCCLFLGARSEVFRDQQDRLAYKFELSFAYRDPDNTNVDGWNKILDETGIWKIPVNKDTNAKIYPYTDFNALFTAPS